jgi:hypothetical protein
MNITVILVVALAIASTLGYAMYERGNVYKGRLDQADRVIEQQIKDNAENTKAVMALSASLGSIQGKASTIERAIYAAPRTDVCSKSAVMQSASGGMRQLLSEHPAPHRPEPAGQVQQAGPRPAQR